MTIFFPDVSSFQGGLKIQPGTPALVAKASEGTYYTDKAYAGFKAQAAAVGAVFSAYHFLKVGNGAAQADYCHGIVGATPVMLDVETEGTSKPTVADCAAFIARMRQLGGRVWGAYFPKWYWQQVGGDLSSLGVAIVSSNYTTYSDTGPGWAAYGGATPTVWQYTSSQSYGGQKVDFNAYRGTAAQLAALINGTITPSTSGGSMSTGSDVWSFKSSVPGLDPIDMRQRLVNAETAAEAARDQANAIKAELDSVKADLGTALTLLRALSVGGVDVNALATGVVHGIGQKLAGA